MADKGAVGVTVQTVIPLFPAEELVAKFDANGLQWQVYDSGPRDGSITYAYAVIGGTSAVVVSGQAWTATDSKTAGPESNTLIRGYVTDLARSLTYQGGNQ